MNFDTYLKLFDNILSGENSQEPYNDEQMVHYTKMNKSRLQRWLKTGTLSEPLKAAIEKIDRPQKWVLITEHWCGDAGHSVPFIYMLSQLNENIRLEIQLRDSGSEIDQYLVNGGKAIPILIIRDEASKDLFVWGPRPKEAQTLFLEEKEKGSDFEEIKTKIQHWYNDDKGKMMQEELLSFFQ